MTNAKILRCRAKILHALRTWFWEHGYLEVNTPVRVRAPAMEPHLEAVKSQDKFLHTSPEFMMKRVLAMGLGRIYQITPCFRDEESGQHHSLEFTMLEWYRIGAGTVELMTDCESLIQAAAKAIGGIQPTFQRIPTYELLDPNLPPEEWFYKWVDQIEPKLQEPTFVTHYPKWQAALARLNGNYADRFEVYYKGIEIGNAFHEELDARELRSRWITNNTIRNQSGRKPHEIDESFLNSVSKMPRCSGIAIGVDRLVMALTNSRSIAETQIQEG